MDVTATMELLKTALAAAFPDNLVTRDGLDFQKRIERVRRAGVITVIAERVTNLKAPHDLADHAGALQIYLLYEFERGEKVSGVQLEDEEFAFAQKLMAFLQAPGAGLCPLDAIAIVFSAQVKKPQGYVFAQLDYSELEL